MLILKRKIPFGFIDKSYNRNILLHVFAKIPKNE